MFVINFIFNAVCAWTTQHTATQAVVTHVYVIKTRTLYKLRDSSIGLYCCRSEGCVISRVNYGTDNAIADRDTGDWVHSDPAARVIRTGETGVARPCRERKLGS